MFQFPDFLWFPKSTMVRLEVEISIELFFWEVLIMDTKQGVLDILNDLTGEDLSDQMDENIFDNGLMDSMASVQMLLNLQEKFDIDVPVSEFNREEWDTPNKIVAKVESLENE